MQYAFCALMLCSPSPGDTDAAEVLKAQAKARAALALACAARERLADPRHGHGYEQCLARSTKDDTPMIVLVGVDRPDLAAEFKFCVLRKDDLAGASGPCLVVSKGGKWLETLPADASAERVRAALNKKAGAGISWVPAVYAGPPAPPALGRFVGGGGSC